MPGSTPTLLTLEQRELFTDTPCPPCAGAARASARKLLETSFSPSAVDAAVSLILSESHSTVAWNGRSFTAPLAEPSARFGVPEPYGLKGGAGRNALKSLLLGTATTPPRDLDLIRRGRYPTAADDEIAVRFMPADYVHGARVELVSSLDRYLSSRDITVNECAVLSSTVHFSLLAALDTLGFTLRPSRYRGGTLHKPPQLSARIVLKMLRLQCEGTMINEPWCVVGIPEQICPTDIDLALHLDKAFQRNVVLAGDFLALCSRLDLLPYSTDLIATTLETLAYLAVGENALLRHVPKHLLPMLDTNG